MAEAMTDVELRRLAWHCRRGKLENDLVLERFMARYGAGLSGTRLAAFRRLLAYTDNDLWELVSGRAEPGDPDLAEVVQLLRGC